MPANESNHTLFSLGRGHEAESLGEFSGYLNPSDLVRMPIGRRLLSATATTEVRERFAQFALAWDVAGWDTFTPPRRGTLVPDSKPRLAEWTPYEHRKNIYAFDDGHWFAWIATDHPQWHKLGLGRDGTVIERPVARTYGPEYTRTQGLDLPQLAAWIMAEATTRLGHLDLTFSARVQPGSSSDDPIIDLTVHTGHEVDGEAVTAELEAIAHAHNWSNPCDPEDRRFTFSVPLFDNFSEAVPGQIDVIDADPYED
ncbi:hypothetical protein [Amycolatopsis sacchari]|uniref:hypothetical protein n=1 Tax=Amycolatopsis sacchari TaxID=115433 RepID=UPI003EBC87BB